MPLPLGKLPPRLDSRTLQLADYLHGPRAASSSGQGTARGETALSSKRAFPPAPRSVDWTAKIPSWPMFSNDTLGDCTAAAAAHMIQCWTANAGNVFTPADAQVIAAYSATGHYIPGNAATDQGAVELDVLNFWRQQGIAGHKIDAYVSFSARNFEHTRAAINIFGGIYIGLALPLSAQSQDVWHLPSFFSRLLGEANVLRRKCSERFSGRQSLPTQAGFSLSAVADSDIRFSKSLRASAPEDHALFIESLRQVYPSGSTDPGSWGGHAVPVLAYDSEGLTCITWGAKKQMTWEFFSRYCDESYAPLSPDWLNAQGTDPAGLDRAQLRADLSELTETAKSPL